MVVALGTNYVVADEPCWGLFELNEQSPGNRGMHRYQIVQVIREGGKVAEYRRDLGPAKRFKVEQFRIPGGGIDENTGKMWIVETVGRLMEIADRMRGRKPKDVLKAIKETEGSLLERYGRQIERSKANH